MLKLIPTEHWEYGIADLFYGIKAINCPDDGYEISLPDLNPCLAINSGRAGLVLALNALNLNADARIGLPLYSCPVVLNSIDTANCKPVFIDIDPETFCISIEDLENKINKLDAIVAVHMFGNTCNMPTIKSIAKNKPVIEDCAQALGSKINNNFTGSFGDISFFSFRSGKYISAGEGGAVFSTNEILRSKLRNSIQKLEGTPYRNDALHTIKTFIRSKLRSQPLYGLVGHKLWNIYNKTNKHNKPAKINVSRIYKSDSAMIKRRLRTITDAVSKQIDNAGFYKNNLILEPNMLCHEKPGMLYNRYIYPILFDNSAQRDLMFDFMYKRGIAAIKPYNDIPIIAATHYEYKHDCPISESIAERVLAIPNHYHLNHTELHHIADTVNKGWNQFRNK